MAGRQALNGTGNNGTNVIRGNGLANTLDGGGIQDVDTLIGAGGNDTYVVNHISDIVDEASGLASDVDTVRSSSTFSLNNTATSSRPGGKPDPDRRGRHQRHRQRAGQHLIGNGKSNILSGLGNNDTLDGRAVPTP